MPTSDELCWGMNINLACDISCIVICFNVHSPLIMLNNKAFWPTSQGKTIPRPARWKWVACEVPSKEVEKTAMPRQCFQRLLMLVTAQHSWCLMVCHVKNAYLQLKHIGLLRRIILLVYQS